MSVERRSILKGAAASIAYPTSLAMFLSEADGVLSDDEASAVQGILREVAALLGRTPEALGSMRRRLGIIVDCLIAVADEIDGDCDLEPHFAGTIRPGQDECEPDEHTHGFEPNLATTARRGFRALVDQHATVEASSPGMLVVALNRLCVALKDAQAEMPAGTCGAPDLPPGSTYAEGAARAKREAAR